MKILICASLAAVTLAAAAPAIAQPGAWGLNQRETWLENRIETGRASGMLDARAARAAERQLQHIRDQQSDLIVRDGVLTAADRGMLEGRLDRLNDWLRDEGEGPPL